LTVTLSMLVQY